MQFTVADKHLIKWLWLSKNFRQNACSKYFFDRRWGLTGLKIKTLVEKSVLGL